MKIASIVSLSLLVIWVVIAIADIWFNVISTAAFFKLTITMALLLVIAVAIALVRREYMEENSMKKDKFID